MSKARRSDGAGERSRNAGVGNEPGGRSAKLVGQVLHFGAEFKADQIVMSIAAEFAVKHLPGSDGDGEHVIARLQRRSQSGQEGL